MLVVRRLNFTLIAGAAALVALAGGCTNKSDVGGPPPSAAVDRVSSQAGHGARDEADDLQRAIGELQRATKSMREMTAQMQEFAREYSDDFGESKRSVRDYPAESLSIDVEKDGKLVGWTVLDSSGFVSRVGENGLDGGFEPNKEQIADIFQKLRRFEMALAAESATEMPRTRVQAQLPGDEMRLTYRQRAARKKFTVRCVTDETAPFSREFDEAMRILSGGKVSADAQQPDAGNRLSDLPPPKQQKPETMRNDATAISDCAQAIQDANAALEGVARAIELIQRAGDPTAAESVSFEFALPEIVGTLILDSNGWLTIYDGMAIHAVIAPYPESRIREALDSARRAIEAFPGAEDKVISVKVATNFYKGARGSVTYRDRAQGRTYRFKCLTDGNDAASPEIDRIISIFHSTANW